MRELSFFSINSRPGLIAPAKERLADFHCLVECRENFPYRSLFSSKTTRGNEITNSIVDGG